MLKIPTDVSLDCSTRRLSWSPVPCADGYNLHQHHEYRATTRDTEFQIPPGADLNGWAVSAFVKVEQEPDAALAPDEAHTPKRDAMILCPAPAEPTAETHDAGETPPELIAGRSLILDDEFSDGVDPAIWREELLWGDEIIINQEEQVYIDTQNGNDPPFDAIESPFSVTSEGNLGITTTPLPADVQAQTDQNFSSGKICAIDRPFKYGYVEVCVKVPCEGDGLWPAVWLLNRRYYDNAAQKNAAEGNVNGTDKFNPEIDFAEWVYGPNYAGPNEVKNALHYFTGDRNDPNNYKRWSLDGGNFIEFNQNTGNVDSQFNVYPDCDGINQFQMPGTFKNFCDKFHTVGVDWQPDYLHYYVDGQIVNCITEPSIIPDQEMYLIINQAVGGTFPYGNPPSQLAPQDQYPQTMEIQYARIWQ